MFDIFKSYDFLTVALGTIFLALSSSIIGCFSVYKGQSLVGDAIGHSSYPGVVLFFILFHTRNPLILTMGAVFFGVIAYRSIQLMVNNSKLRLDAILAIVLTGYFGLGIVLKTFIQGNGLYTKASQAGLKGYIFGSASYILKDDVFTILMCCLISLSIAYIYRRELIISIFDKEYSKSVGINNAFIDFILLILMILMISVGLKTVGAILISSFLIIPCICANQHTNNIRYSLLIACFVGVFSSFIGTYLSVIIKGFSTGPSIVIVMGILTLISMFIGKYGVFKMRFLWKS